jgi:hypothetical protein
VPTEEFFLAVEVRRRATRVREVSVRRVRLSLSLLSVVVIVVVVLFSGLSLVFDERARVSCFVRCVFFPRERERERKEGRFRDSRTDFFATFPEYLPQVYETRAKDEGATRRGIERERERGKVRSFLRVGIVYLVVVVIFV